MQFTTALLAAAVFLGVSAVPTCQPQPKWEPPSSTTEKGSCKSDSKQYCCNDKSDVVGLSCVLSGVLGQTCNTQSICCVNVGSGSQSCTNIDGTSISVPITIDVL